MDSTTPKPFVFVLMPFNEDFRDVYELGIKEACKEAGAYCERVDEQIFEGSILERIYNQISKADIIISDMTGRNPNVFYETGYAHALGKKRVILLTRKSEDIPFDLKHYPHIIYQNISSLKQELIKRVSWYVNNPENQIPNDANNLELYVRGMLIKGLLEIRVNTVISSEGRYGVFDLDFKNRSKYNLQDFFQVGVIIPYKCSLGGFKNDLGTFELMKPITTSEGNVYQVGNINSIFPDAWESIRDLAIKVHDHISLVTIIAYTMIGTIKFPFNLVIDK